MIRVNIAKEEGCVLINRSDITAIVTTDVNVQVFLKDEPHVIYLESNEMKPAEVFKKVAHSMNCNIERHPSLNKPHTMEAEVKSNCFCYIPDMREHSASNEKAGQLKPYSYLPSINAYHHTNKVHDATVNITVNAWGDNAAEKEEKLKNLIIGIVENTDGWDFDSHHKNKSRPPENHQQRDGYTTLMEMKINGDILETIVRIDNMHGIGKLSRLPTNKMDISLVKTPQIREIHAQAHECIYQAILAAASSEPDQDE